MEAQTIESTFAYLSTWSPEHLKERHRRIVPYIKFLLEMHNAKERAVMMHLSCFDANGKALEETIMFQSLVTKVSTPGNGYPASLELFIHELLTVLCAEKRAIEDLLHTN